MVTSNEKCYTCKLDLHFAGGIYIELVSLRGEGKQINARSEQNCLIPGGIRSASLHEKKPYEGMEETQVFVKSEPCSTERFYLHYDLTSHIQS